SGPESAICSVAGTDERYNTKYLDNRLSFICIRPAPGQVPLTRCAPTSRPWGTPLRLHGVDSILNHMVLYRASDPRAVDEVLSALADPTRRAILGRLSQGEASVSELAQPFAVSLPAVAKHVRVLERAGLLSHRKTGRVRRCRIVIDRLQLAS